ncbi:AAA family ATPase, partial [Actinoplanes sp. NPDC048791]|uniref:AAA family ATPase n=1 Tax=Actinoplanes sp. NPDC048791 TaxID=3154623 RepID=UPI0033E67DB4
VRRARRLNPGGDDALAAARVALVALDPAQKAGRLSGGQRAQLALTIAAAKRPELLIFDEPVASLDPLARRAFLQSLMEFVAELEVGVILSSHLLSDLERVCDHMIVLTGARVQLAGDVDELLAAHYRLVAARGDLDELPPGVEVIQAEHTDRQSTLIVHDTLGAVPGIPVEAERIGLEDMILAYLTRAALGAVGGFTPQTLEAHR